MSEERYMVLDLEVWEEAKNKAHLPHNPDLLDLESASKMANGRASRTQRPQFLLKVVPVQLHRATVKLDVDQL